MFVDVYLRSADCVLRSSPVLVLKRMDRFYSLDQLLDSIQLVSRGKSARGHDSSSDGIANPSAHDSAIETRQRTKRPAPRKQQSNAVLSGHERKIQERNITFILKKHLEHILALDGGSCVNIMCNDGEGVH